MSPLFPKRRMIESVSEKGGEMTGSVASAVMAFLPLMLVLATAKAKRKPTKVESVAVRAPSWTEPARAWRYCLLRSTSFQTTREKRPSLRTVSRSASKSG